MSPSVSSMPFSSFNLSVNSTVPITGHVIEPASSCSFPKQHSQGNMCVSGAITPATSGAQLVIYPLIQEHQMLAKAQRLQENKLRLSTPFPFISGRISKGWGINYVSQKVELYVFWVSKTLNQDVVIYIRILKRFNVFSSGNDLDLYKTLFLWCLRTFQNNNNSIITQLTSLSPLFLLCTYYCII